MNRKEEGRRRRRNEIKLLLITYYLLRTYETFIFPKVRSIEIYIRLFINAIYGPNLVQEHTEKMMIPIVNREYHPKAVDIYIPQGEGREAKNKYRTD